LIETFYCDKIAQLTDENKAKEKNFKRMKGLQANKKDKKNELEQALIDSIEQTKANIERRRIVQNMRHQNKDKKPDSVGGKRSGSTSRIGLKDFNNHD